MENTPPSLLERVRLSIDQQAWERFVQLYTPLLHHWARKLGVPDEDAADLIQYIFAVLVRRLPEFRYDARRRFRGWLWTITLNKWRERRRHRLSTPQADPEQLDALEVPDDAELVSEVIA